MKNLERMYHARTTKNNIEHLRKWEKKYNELVKDCNHDVIVLTYNNKMGKKMDGTCLFCQKTFNNKNEVGKEVAKGSCIADISFYWDKVENTDYMFVYAQDVAEELMLDDHNIAPEKLAREIEDSYKKLYESEVNK